MREDFKGINENTPDLPHLLKVRQFIDYIYLSTHIYVKNSLRRTGCCAYHSVNLFEALEAQAVGYYKDAAERHRPGC